MICARMRRNEAKNEWIHKKNARSCTSRNDNIAGDVDPF